MGQGEEAASTGRRSGRRWRESEEEGEEGEVGAGACPPFSRPPATPFPPSADGQIRSVRGRGGVQATTVGAVMQMGRQRRRSSSSMAACDALAAEA